MNAAVQLLLVGAGGFAGAISRYAVQRWVASRYASLFPYGTLAVNIAGSFLLGLLIGLGVPPRWHPVQLSVGIGFLGAFTTYSTFASESLQLLQRQQFGKFVAYQGASFGLSIAIAVAGYACGQALPIP